MTKYLGNAKSVGFARVAEAAARYVTANDGEVEIWRAYDGLARELGTYDQPSNGYGRQATERFRGQVRRAFDQMTVRGELIKVGRDDHEAQQEVGRQAEPRYYTAAAYERARAVHAAVVAAEEAQLARWTAIGNRLGALGLPRPVEPVSPMLEPGDWEALLQLAEGGLIRHLASEGA
jgi:hypothetical protein